MTLFTCGQVLACSLTSTILYLYWFTSYSQLWRRRISSRYRVGQSIPQIASKKRMFIRTQRALSTDTIQAPILGSRETHALFPLHLLLSQLYCNCFKPSSSIPSRTSKIVQNPQRMTGEAQMSLSQHLPAPVAFPSMHASSAETPF